MHQIEKELWEAADQLRANSRLTAAEYSMPVLGLIFLRHADNRFKAYLGEIEQAIPAQVPVAQREALIKLEFQGKAAMYLPEEARFDYLADLPQGKDVGQAIDDAMELIEEEYEVLKGALPRGYTTFERDLLAELLKIFSRDSLKKATGDVFGRIYEYFLNKFAQSGAQEGGEFFTPPSLVRMSSSRTTASSWTRPAGRRGCSSRPAISSRMCATRAPTTRRPSSVRRSPTPTPSLPG